MRKARQGNKVLQTLAAVALLSLTMVGTGARAAGEMSGEETIRASHPLGAYMALWGDPFPALLGANLAYNVYDFLRLNAGVGTDSANRITATTFGMGAKLMVPNMTLSPVIGANWSATNVSGSNATATIRGIQQNGNRFYGTAGLDWQTTLGLNLGAGYNAAFNDIGGGTFYITAGWYL